MVVDRRHPVLHLALLCVFRSPRRVYLHMCGVCVTPNFDRVCGIVVDFMFNNGLRFRFILALLIFKLICFFLSSSL